MTTRTCTCTCDLDTDQGNSWTACDNAVCDPYCPEHGTAVEVSGMHDRRWERGARAAHDGRVTITPSGRAAIYSLDEFRAARQARVARRSAVGDDRAVPQRRVAMAW